MPHCHLAKIVALVAAVLPRKVLKIWPAAPVVVALGEVDEASHTASTGSHWEREALRNACKAGLLLPQKMGTLKTYKNLQKTLCPGHIVLKLKLEYRTLTACLSTK